METAPLKPFATWARTALIREVRARVAAVLAPASNERVESADAVAAIERDIAAAGGGDTGRGAVADKVAYTWFNRIIALRFMDANGYTGTGVVSPQRGHAIGQPEILADAKRGVIDAAVVTDRRAIEAITALLDGTRRSDDPQGEAYALLLTEYCRYWNRSMPFMFEREGDYTELLVPANLLADDSVLARTATVLTHEVCQDVEVIGWLYQFYISERKDEVFAGFKKSKKAGAAEIPAATQLFTPHWIVRYLVENSLGRIWMLNRPTSRLVDQMDYYMVPVDKATDFVRINGPEELRLLDPACGSGHMLTYAFDLLYAIYEEEGFSPADIPGLILANNLYGLEIDARAGALAAFALTMKARRKLRTFFGTHVEPNICVLTPVRFTAEELDLLVTHGADREAELEFWHQFTSADTFGSLIRADRSLISRSKARLSELDADGDLLRADLIGRARRVITQAESLVNQFVAVVTNPPYMGSGNMSAAVSAWIKETYPNEKQDLYACFLVRCDDFVVPQGCIAMVTGDTWMTIKSFEKLRLRLLDRHAVHSFIHMHDVTNHADIFGANAAFVLGKDENSDTIGTYVYLDASNAEVKATHLRDAIRGAAPERVYLAAAAQFKEVPGAPLVFRISATMRAALQSPRRLGTVAEPRVGLQTNDNGRFVRFWHEISHASFGRGLSRDDAAASSFKWFPLNKGGQFRKWYGNQDVVVNWENDGAEMFELASAKYGSPTRTIKNLNYYFRPAVSWSKVGTGIPAFRYFPPGFIFDNAGGSIFGTTRQLLALAAICNSNVSRRILAAISPTMNLEAGTLAQLPVVDLPDWACDAVAELVEMHRADWNSTETSWDFDSLEVLSTGSPSIAGAVAETFNAGRMRANRARHLEVMLNAEIANLYGLGDEVDPDVPLSQVTLAANPDFRCTSAIDDREVAKRHAYECMVDVISYAVGCMFGRFSLDGPGLILADQGSTLQHYSAKVASPTFAPDKDNVIPIVDGDWFEDDIVTRFRTFLRATFGDIHFEENLRFVTESLGVTDIRDYFVKSFFKDHVQRYKKRPIYWLFSSPKGSFNALIYMHRYTPSTVSTVLNEYLREFKSKLEASRQHYERRALSDGTPQERAAADKEVDRLRKVLLELDEYEHDVLYPLATQQISLDLDDGVKANYPKLGAALKKIPGLEASDG